MSEILFSIFYSNIFAAVWYLLINFTAQKLIHFMTEAESCSLWTWNELSYLLSISTVHKEGISAEALPLTSDLMKYPCIAFKKPQEELKVNWRSAFGTSTLVFSNMSKKPKSANSPLSPAASHSNSLATDKGLYKYSICQGTTSPNYASGGWQRQSAELSNGESVASYSHPSKKMRMDHSPFPSNNAQNGTLNSRWVTPSFGYSWIRFFFFLSPRNFVEISGGTKSICRIFNATTLR